MVGARIEMLQAVVALMAPQGAETTTLARDHDACDMQPGRPTPRLQFFSARCTIDHSLKQFPGKWP
jgi:hypothetical protein